MYGINNKIIDQLSRLCDLKEINGESFWSIRAYKKAIDSIRALDIPITNVSDLQSIDNIGKGIAQSIKEYLSSGFIYELVKLEEKYPVEALSMTIVPGIGAKTAYKLHKDGIRNFEELVLAAESGKIKNENIIRGIKLAQNSFGRIPINDVYPVVIPIMNALRSCPYVQRAEFAGSFRRGKETVKDVDIIVCSKNRAETTKLFQMYGEELVTGSDKVRIIARIDARVCVQVDLLYCEMESFGSSLAYFTGSKEHNVVLRSLASSKGMKINEHGFWSKSGERLGGEYEEELYSLLNIPFHPPELREGNKILESIPELISEEDIDSDWHVHTKWSSDAVSSVEDMLLAAKDNGMKTIGLTDHTEKQYGWSIDDIKSRANEIFSASNKVGIRAFSACETGINIDGTLDWSNESLSQMDYVIASIHRGHNTNVEERLIAAIKNPYVKVIGHPTGRILNRRDIPDINWGNVFDECAKHNKLLEINGARIDLPEHLLIQAKKHGCKFVISSDAHSTDQYIWQKNAISLARRAQLTKNDLHKVRNNE